MSESKRICTRIIHKHAPSTTWESSDCTFVPEVGELIIYEPAEEGAPSRIKIGDGSTYENGEKKVVKDLPFVVPDYSGDISELNKALSDHGKDTTVHITADERAAWNGAKTHAESAHVALNHKHSGADITSGTVALDRLPTISVAKGGTGATTAVDALKNLGLDATATELNYVQGVTSSIQTQLDNKAAASHTHDDRYYTEGEVDDLLAGKSDEHNHPYSPTGHTHVTSDVTALTGYTKASTAAEIAATDSLNVALGKLQKTLDTKAASSMTGYSKAGSASAITTNDTVLTAIGKLEKALDGKSDTHNHPYSPTGHTHNSSAVIAMTSYAKATAAGAIATTDSLNVAMGKLEKGLDERAPRLLTGYSKATAVSALATTDTVIAALGKLEKALDGKAATHNHPYSPTGHTHASSDVTAMTGYTKASAAAAIAATDSLNVAIGKLEKGLDGKAPSSHNHAASNITSGTLSLDRLPTITVAKGGTGATTAAAALVNLGLEATASELNVLKGITATTTELNYVDGVTSNIQTQLNGKAPSSHNHAAGNITSGTLSSDRLPTVPVSKGGTGATTAAQALVNLNALAKSGDTMTGRLQLNMSNPHIHMKDTGYTTDWYFQAYQDQLAFGPTFASAVKTDKTGNMTVPGTVTVENKVKLDYDSTNECLNFVFV